MLLHNAKAKIQSLEVYETPLAHGADEASALSIIHPARSMLLKLLKDLVALSKNQDALKVLSNILIAALHLACMLRGTANKGRSTGKHFFFP